MVLQGTVITPMSLTTFKEKAAELSSEFELPPNFVFDDKWLLNFMKRFGLQMTSVLPNGDPIPSSSADEKQASKEAWPNDLLPFLAPNSSAQTDKEGHEDRDGETRERSADEKSFVVLIPQHAGENITKKVLIDRLKMSGDRKIPHQYGKGRSISHLSEEMRMALIEKHTQCPDWSQTQLADWLKETAGVSVHRATIGRHLRRSMGAVVSMSRRIKRERDDEDGESEEGSLEKSQRIEGGDIGDNVQLVEEQLHSWIIAEKRLGVRIEI